MKISTLLETNTTLSTDPAGLQSQQAPKFGRDPNVLEDDEKLDETTTSGAVATVAQPMGSIQRHGKGSIFAGIKTSKKFPNSASVKESLSEMDKSQPSHGRDGKISHSTYGSRDKDSSAGPERTAKMTTADKMMKDAHKVMMKSMSDADKVKKGWRNPNMKEGVAEGVTPASVSKVLRLIDRHHPEWFDNYGMGEVEDTVVDLADMGQFSGMSAADALELVGQELESLYGQQGVAEGDDRGDYHSTARAANQASRTAKSRQDHAKAADLHSRAATYALSAGQDQSVIHDHQMAAWEHNRASKGLKEQGVAEGILGDREYNRVMPVVKRIASEVSDYDRDEFGEELWSLLDQKYGSKFAQSVLQDSLDFYWDTYTELTGPGLDEASVYKKDQDLSSVSTQELEAFVKKHWGGGIPTWGQGESVKRAIRELRRRQKQGVAEVSKGTLDRYVSKAIDAHGHADAAARMSKDDPTKRSYHKDQKRTAEKRRQGISRALDRMSREESIEEYGDTAKGQKMLTKVQKRAVDRMIKADDKRDAKAAKKNQDTANRAWDRMKDVAEAGTKPGWMLKQDPKLAAKVKTKTDLAKKRQASYGDFSAGKKFNDNPDDNWSQDFERRMKKGVAEGYDNFEFHTSVENGKFLPSKFGNKRFVYLHDLNRTSPSTGGPQLVTIDDADAAKQIASQYGGKVVKTKLDTFRIVKPAEQGLTEEQVDENLRKWFKEKWVRFGPDGKIRGACARGSDSEGKPKCLPQAKAHALGKKGRKYAASKKRREDPNPERKGAAINVATKKK